MIEYKSYKKFLPDALALRTPVATWGNAEVWTKNLQQDQNQRKNQQRRDALRFDGDNIEPLPYSSSTKHFYHFLNDLSHALYHLLDDLL